MSKLRTESTSSFPGNDILSVYRRRIWSLFGIVSIALFLPSSIFIYFEGHRGLAISAVCFLGILTLNGFSAIRTKAPRATMALFVAALMAITGLSLLERGIYGIFWTFPAILFINFLAFGRLSRIYTAIYFVYITVIMFSVLDIQIAARAVLGLLITILFTNIFLGIIDQLQTKLVEQSIVDPLTGALNRREMDTVLQEAVERKRRTQTPASLLIFDVDNFKIVNDTFGHAVGDRVLKDLVTLISSRSRLLDRLFRLGGEEFMLFLPDTDGVGAGVLAEEIRLLVADGVLIEDRVITISMGVSELEFNESIDEWMRRGDDALYLAKDKGRNQIVEALLAEAYC